MSGHITLNKLGTEENFPKTTKNLYKNSRVTITLYDETLKCFSPKTEIRQGGLLSILLFNSVLKVLADIGRQKIKNNFKIIKIKVIQFRNKTIFSQMTLSSM